MNENIPTSESGAEKFPNEREMLNLFEEIISGDFEITRSVEDEEGLSALDVITIGEDGEKVGYDYRRKDFAGNTVIDVVFYVDDIPCGGHALKKFKEGAWVDEV
jgi:hypothetical protein